MARRLLPALLLVGAVAWGGCAAMREQIAEYDGGYSEDPYGDLAPYGSWVEVASYGSVWCPEVSSAWQPYTVGYWVYTDDGWFWVSEDPWGSVPYHYGRWALDAEYGWVWVPDDVWAPAWVAWRYGSGWVGWAPLPPDVSWQPGIGLDLAGYDLDSNVDPWCFIEARDFGTRRVRVHVEPSERKPTLLKETRDVTQYVRGPRPIEDGMRPDLIREIGDKKIERYQIVDASKPVSKTGVTIRGTQVKVYRPHVDSRTVVRERASVAPPTEQPKVAPPRIERADRESPSENRVAASEQATEPRPEVKTPQPRPVVKTPEPRERVHELRPSQPKVQERNESEESRNASVEEDKRRVARKGEEAGTDRGEIRKPRDASPKRDESDVPKREPEIQESSRREPKEDARNSEVRERDDDTGKRERVVPERTGPPEDRTRGR